MRARIIGTVLLVGALALSACDEPGSSSDDPTQPDPTATTSLATEGMAANTEEPEAAAAHASGCELVDDGTVRVTSGCLDADWPLTVESADVYCTDGSSALVRAEGQGIYALNGMAGTHHPDLPPLEDIWLENPEIEGTRVSIGPLIDIALDLC